MQIIIKLPEDVKNIIETFEQNGFLAYAVGGCVRDSLLGLAPKDWDICTDALPEQGIALFPGCKTVPTGLKHGTFTLLLNGSHYEITTFRIDGEYSDCRRPDSVTFTCGIEYDLARRDFTVNAMAYSHEKGLVDPFGGRDDIDSKLIRAAGDPYERFKEDSLRIMRALRFAAVYGFRIEDATAAAMSDCRHLLRNIAIERIGSELAKTLMGDGLVSLFTRHSDIVFEIIPELRPALGFDQRNKWHIHDIYTHTLHAVENSPKDLEVRLAMLLHDIGKPDTFFLDGDGQGHFHGHAKVSRDYSDTILRRLKFDNATRDAVNILVLMHDTRFGGKAHIKRLLNRIGEHRLSQLIDCRMADGRAHSNLAHEYLPINEETRRLMHKIIENNEAFSLKDLKIDGKDLLHLGIPEGRSIGLLLQDILGKVMDGILENDRETLIEYAATKNPYS